jgi:hypothetical protein
MKKAPFLKRLIRGENLVGQILYGVVDALPLPNILNIPRAILKSRPQIETRDLLLETLRKLDVVRFAVGAVLSYLIITGRLTFESLNTWLDTLSQVMQFIERITTLL